MKLLALSGCPRRENDDRKAWSVFQGSSTLCNDGSMTVTTLDVDRKQLSTTRIFADADRPLVDGEVRVSVEHFALTSNNITYGVFGDGMRYWDFFPALQDTEILWGRIPVWGFAEVIDSQMPSVEVGRRIYGYLPMSTDLIVKPGRVDERGFVDTSEHRSAMAATYNRYMFTDHDPTYRADREPQQMILWPLFMTSFMIDDYLGQNVLEDDASSIATVVISSASSKTAIGAAHLLARRTGVTVVGLTSAKNADFVRSLDCYHRVVTYDQIGDLPSGTASDITAYVDIAGDRSVTYAVHAHYQDDLSYSMVVGSTHWDAPPATGKGLAGPKPEFLFAPSQIALRSKEWGREGLDQRVGESWNRFSEWTGSWMKVEQTAGAMAVEKLYQELLAGRVDPTVGHVCSMR
jgi:hypothetical protein